MAGQLPVHIACQRGKKVQLGQMLFFVQHSLVQVGNAPALGDVEAERRSQLLGRCAGDGVAPGAERHQQFAVGIKGQVAVHHGGNANAAHLGQGAAVFLLYIGGKGGVSTLQALPDLFQWVGPDAVVQLVFPGIIPLCQRGMLRADQHCLDAGRAEFDAESCLFRYKVGHIAGLLFGKRNAVFLIC